MNKLTFTLLLIGIVASVALARTSPQIRRPFKFTPGQTYVYEYRGRQWNGLAKLADQYAGLTLECDVILQALPESQGKEVLMKLDDIKVEQLHTQALDNNDIRKLNQGQEVNQRQMVLYKEELSKPIRFTYLDGKVLSFLAETNDAEWSINIKKSILSLFQLDLAPVKIIKSPSKQLKEDIYGYQSEDAIRSANEMPLVYPIYEESFGGICETLYEIDSVDNVEKRDQLREQLEFNDVLNVTKTVNYKNCLTDPSVSYDRHSFNVNTQTIKGKLFSKLPTVSSQSYYPVPEELKAKYSNVYSNFDDKLDNVASPVPVERYSWTKYNITTAPQSLVERRSVPVSSPADMSLIEGIYSEAKIKYEADGDVLISDTQQSLKLITCSPTVDLARVAPEISQLATVQIRSPIQYQTIQCELNTQKLKFYQALTKYAQLRSTYQQKPTTYGQQTTSPSLYSHQLILPFALSASWYPIVATGSQSIADLQQDGVSSLDRFVEPEQLAKSYEHLLISLAEDVLSEDVAQSKKAAEKVVRLVNIVSFLPKYKLVELYERIVEHIQKNKLDQVQSRGKQALVDNEEVSKWKVVRKLFLDSLPLAGSKQAIEMIELLIETQRVKNWEAKEMCEAVPTNLRYPDAEIIDAFIRISQLPHVRKSRSLFASCSIACGKMIGQAYAKSKDASYKPTTYEPINKLPTHLREDEIVKQVVEEADPRRSYLPSMQSPEQQDLYERLVLDEQDLLKYVKLYKQMLNKASQYHEKVIYIETLAHMKVPQVLPILEPFVSGRLSLAQCLGNQPLDINRPVEQSQWYNYYGRQRYPLNKRVVMNQQLDNSQKDWSEEESFAAEECNYMRTIAIYAMAHVAHQAPGKVQSLLLPVFDNTYEPYQIRIAAFTTLMMTRVDEHILERIASQMWREPCKEVASFVVGTIDTMSKFTAPKMSPYKQAALKAAESMPKQYLDTWKFSWLAGGDHFNKQKQTGLTWLAEIVKSNVSSIPRAAYAQFGKYHGQSGSKYDNHFEFGFTSKGLESLLKEYLAYNQQQQIEGQESNILASIFENLYDAKDDIVKYYREARDSLKSTILSEEHMSKINPTESFTSNFFFKRQQPIDGVNTQAGKQSRSLFSTEESMSRPKRSTVTFQARTSSDDDEEAKLTIFSKLFDSTSYHAMDKKQILNLLEKSDEYLKMVAEELIMGGKLHYVKMMMPSNMWHMVPSQLGLPMIVTHRTPIVFSLKIDGSANGQLTSNKLSQIYRQQATGEKQIPNVLGHNFVLPMMNGLNITALVHPKIIHSNYRFMFSVEQAQNECYGVQVEKSHQISLPMEVSVAYSKPKQLVSLAIEPKTPLRMIWTKEAAKTFINQMSLAGPQADNWLGQEHLIRVPSKQEQYKRLQRSELFVPSLLSSVQTLLNEPREKQLQLIEELETPYKFEHRFTQPILDLEFYLEGVTDDEDVARTMGKPELTKPSIRSTNAQLQWTSTEEVDDLDQHSKSGPLSEYLHVLESAMNRPSKYLEFYTTLKPEQQQSKSPVYRFDFVLSGKQQQQQYQQQQTIGRRNPMPINRLDVQSSKLWESIEQTKKLNKYQQQQMIQEAY